MFVICGLSDSTAVPSPAGKPIQAQLRLLKKDEHGLQDKLIPAASWRVLTRLHDAGNDAVTLPWEGVEREFDASLELNFDWALRHSQCHFLFLELDRLD